MRPEGGFSGRAFPSGWRPFDVRIAGYCFNRAIAQLLSLFCAKRIEFLAGNNLADATDRSNTAGVVVIGRGLIACFADFEQPLINAVVASCCPVLAARFSRNTGELIIGIDATLGDLRGGLRRFGFAGGYQHTSLNIVDRASSGGVDTYHVAAYRDVARPVRRSRWRGLWLQRYPHQPIHCLLWFHRHYTCELRRRHDAGFGEVGYSVSRVPLAFEPFAAVAHVNLRTDGFTEVGGAVALTALSSSIETTFSTVGLRAAAALPWQAFSGVVARGSLGW